jgi:uncharacterized membrane protein YdcZ (DUF606 family)
MQETDLIKWYFDHLAIFTTALGAIAFLIACGVYRESDKVVYESLSRAASWCMLPNGLAFLFCSANASLVPRIADSGVAFFMGGLALASLVLPDIFGILGVRKTPKP